ncbi:uncharacterized protein LOC116260280 isoform X2 [Nymphaea colorata]|uniref:uncharacterized protein LOC116260280 isoform X2 n=1 Tax=Nymphaea colorata TaxID=210225 RepID=UPI00214EAFE4|nr:uncharacterized protein LOC116260280 isoform X2 [Nymphaea colorata]
MGVEVAVIRLQKEPMTSPELAAPSDDSIPVSDAGDSSQSFLQQLSPRMAASHQHLGLQLSVETNKRHKCPACYKQYKKKAHLVEHMRESFHSAHEPVCDICKKHFKYFESLREHLTEIFADQGCTYCLRIIGTPGAINGHRERCMNPPEILQNHQGRPVAALDCEMVGGGSDGTLDLCARVCLVGEDERVLFQSFVLPLIAVSDYRSEITGITEADFRNALPLCQVRVIIQNILYNGESIGRIRLDGGRARVLVGHGLKHALDCLDMDYPVHLIRDTAEYLPLMRTNHMSFSLKYLTQAFLGYSIQEGVHQPYVDAVASLRLYRKLRSLAHQPEYPIGRIGDHRADMFDGRSSKELENLNPEELINFSRSNYWCWCLDRSAVRNLERSDL